MPEQKLTKDKVEIIVLKNNDLERKESDLRYAPMWVKVVMVWGGSVLGGAVILAIARLILK